jgi:hypothetical protein
VLQAVCSGSSRWAYFTVAATAAGAAAGENLTISLEPSSATDPFRRQDYALPGTSDCFTSGSAPARLFRIERYRYHVRPVPTPAGGWEPYLVLDTGTDLNEDGEVGEDDERIIAEGIELLQVGYVMANPALPARGVTPGTPITFARGAAGGQSADDLTLLDFPGVVDPNVPNPEGSPYFWTSWYRWSVGPPAHARRLDDHQANVVALRIAISARSASMRPDARPGLARTPLFNADQFPDWLGAQEPWDRVTFESTIPLRNMAIRVMTDF